MRKFLAPSELILNPNGSLYHCNVLPENIGKTIFLVGDPERVPVVSSFFDTIEFKTHKREIVTHTGYKNGQKISCISTGMGTDNIDIVLNELDAAVNIDLNKKQINEEHESLTFIRLGTSGALQEDIEVDSYLASSHGLGFDGLMHYYQNTERFTFNPFVEEFMEFCQWNTKLPRPYLVPGNDDLIQKAKNLGLKTGVTATASGFYGPQGRELRLQVSDKSLNENLQNFKHNDLRITNFEMETSGIFGLSALMGHKAISINCIIANRIKGEFSKDSHASVLKMVDLVINNFI